MSDVCGPLEFHDPDVNTCVPCSVVCSKPRWMTQCTTYCGQYLEQHVVSEGPVLTGGMSDSLFFVALLSVTVLCLIVLVAVPCVLVGLLKHKIITCTRTVTTQNKKTETGSSESLIYEDTVRLSVDEVSADVINPSMIDSRTSLAPSQSGPSSAGRSLYVTDQRGGALSSGHSDVPRNNTSDVTSDVITPLMPTDFGTPSTGHQREWSMGSNVKS